MRFFTVPFNINTEDKIIGGYVSLRQFFWLFGAFLVTLYCFVLNTHYILKAGGHIHIITYSLVIRIIITLITISFSLLLSFLKIKEVNLDRYIYMHLRFKFRKHTYKL